MPETLVQRARALSQSAQRVQVHQRAVQDAKRLRERTEELRRALEGLQQAARRWQVLRDGQVPLAGAPDPGGVATAVQGVRAALQFDASPPDEHFLALRRALQSLTSSVEATCSSAWARYTASRTSAAGLDSIDAVRPAAYTALARLRQDVRAAEQALPATVQDIRRFDDALAQVSRRLEEEHVREMPAHLSGVLRRAREMGLPLSELTAEDLHELKQRGLDRELRVRWSTS
ncbi:hypothetical protein [Kineococcus sp. SYSU DK005]|uniref:hypothetical protein n=1 Tax=Kineococcus sp. SYSU DK005 TaxID=3383126 RepID=UPI003D7DA4A3